jgi:hypothetical protein
VAEAEVKDAERHCYQYRMTAITEEVARNEERRPKKSRGVAEGASARLATVEMLVGSAENACAGRAEDYASSVLGKG